MASFPLFAYFSFNANVELFPMKQLPQPLFVLHLLIFLLLLLLLNLLPQLIAFIFCIVLHVVLVEYVNTLHSAFVAIFSISL